jgi:hypothetical protein
VSGRRPVFPALVSPPPPLPADVAEEREGLDDPWPVGMDPAEALATWDEVLP